MMMIASITERKTDCMASSQRQCARKILIAYKNYKVWSLDVTTLVVTSWDNTGGGGVIAWGSISTSALTEQESYLTARTVRNSSWNGVTLCDL